MTPSNQSQWHIAYTYPNAERKINNVLIKKNYNVYLPLQKVLKQWSDRKKKLEVPLFPNYIFLNIKENERWSVLNIPGIVKFLFYNGKPSVISENEINAIKMILNTNYSISVENEFTVGDKVKIVHGPLSGLEGVLSKKHGEQRFIISLETMSKVVSINLDSSHLQRSNQVLSV